MKPARAASGTFLRKSAGGIIAISPTLRPGGCRTGRRSPSWPVPGSAPVRSRAAHRPQEGRLPDPWPQNERKKERNTVSKPLVAHPSSQRDNLSTSHDYRKPLFTGFLELSDVVESCKKCGISNTQATYMQQSYLNSKDFKRDVFLRKRKTSLSFCL